ncbi:MAG: HD domain-containing protein [Chloroflexota bacterium]
MWEVIFESWLDEQMAGADAAHDRAHIQRVVKTAKELAGLEGADLDVVIPAAWLHDCVTVPKDSDKRPFASRMAAKAAGQFLIDKGYPAEKISNIEHAIAAHSFTAQITPETIEAKVVQDADRLDAIGAIGISRCLMLGGVMGKPLYSAHEPIPETRTPNDKEYVIDHFFIKLFKLQETMQTEAGRREAIDRTTFMKRFLDKLESEVE